jgi:SAM-dependent methyltransferase
LDAYSRGALLVTKDDSVEPDIFGVALWDWVRGGDEPEVFEREDGYCHQGDGRHAYLVDVREWHDAERLALRHARGRVLDVGCGAGRVSLELQRRGVEVVGLDSSQYAADASTLMGVRDVWCKSIDDLTDELANFDSFVLYGNNFGMLGTPTATRRWMSGWAKLTGPNARILAGSANPYCGGAPGMTRGYYWRNKTMGRYPGQLAYRYHYGGRVGPWSMWLFVSSQEMRTMLKGTGWTIESVVAPTPYEPYVAILIKE